MSSSPEVATDSTGDVFKPKNGTALHYFLRWREFLLIVPGIHLLVCFCHMFFYNYSFGLGLSNFSSPTDAFSVSLFDIIPTYVGFAIWLSLGSFVGLALRRRGAQSPPSRTLKQADLLDKLPAGMLLLSAILVFLLFISYRIVYGFYYWLLL